MWCVECRVGDVDPYSVAWARRIPGLVLQHNPEGTFSLLVDGNLFLMTFFPCGIDDEKDLVVGEERRAEVDLRRSKII